VNTPKPRSFYAIAADQGGFDLAENAIHDLFEVPVVQMRVLRRDPQDQFRFDHAVPSSQDKGRRVKPRIVKESWGVRIRLILSATKLNNSPTVSDEPVPCPETECRGFSVPEKARAPHVLHVRSYVAHWVVCRWGTIMVIRGVLCFSGD
jgi:hypothetical protein